MFFAAYYFSAFYCSSYCVTIIVSLSQKRRGINYSPPLHVYNRHMNVHMYIYIHTHTYAYTVQEKYLLNKARTLVADGIHQVHFTIGGNSSGFAGKRRKEINCSNLSTSCLNLLCEILKQTCCSYSHVITVHTRVYIIRFQCYFLKNMLLPYT